jgi:hypothetical protein
MVTPDKPTRKRSASDADAPTIATAAATLKSKLAGEDTTLTAPERALMEQWLTPLADAPTGHSRSAAARTATKSRGRSSDDRDSEYSSAREH